MLKQDIFTLNVIRATVSVTSTSSSSRTCVTNHNQSARKQRLHLQSVAEIRWHSALSEERIRHCDISSGSHRKDTDQCQTPVFALSSIASHHKMHSRIRLLWSRTCFVLQRCTNQFFYFINIKQPLINSYDSKRNTSQHFRHSALLFPVSMTTGRYRAASIPLRKDYPSSSSSLSSD